MTDAGYLGIDVGSISTNLVVINLTREVVFSSYARGIGSPIASVQAGLRRIGWQLSHDFVIKGACVTGSGRALIGALVGADIVKNEISAHARAALELHPNVQTIWEIGGQDSKVTVVRNGRIVDFAMNLVCAAGTGSFLDAQAKRLDMTIDQLSEQAILSDNPTPIAGRCTVFAESDMIHKQQAGYHQHDIVMGLCHAMVRNYLSNVCRGKEIRPPIIFQGGVSANKGIYRAFNEAVRCDIHIPRYNMVMGAYGAALIAERANIRQTNFRGLDVATQNIVTQIFVCEDCPNTCEIVALLDTDSVLCRSGGRCSKWEGINAPRAEIRGTPPADALASIV